MARDFCPTHVPELLDGLDISPGAREAILARVEISAAAPAGQVAAADLAGVAHIDDEPSPSIAGGNQRLVIALADQLGDAVRLGEPVTRVEWGDNVRVLSRKGGAGADIEGIEAADLDEIEADFAVIAVPAGVLDRIVFDPPLPEPLAGALRGVGYGHAAKLFVPLHTPAPPSAVMNVPERYWTWTATGDGDVPQPVVSAFAGSAPALERLGVADGPGAWVESLARSRSDLDLAPEGAVLSTWDDDPWVRAAYSTTPPPELAGAVEHPTGPLAFAGEHTAGEYHGLMEGAIRSGRRAASSLLRRTTARPRGRPPRPGARRRPSRT
jgi:monoamine oxidase